MAITLRDSSVTANSLTVVPPAGIQDDDLIRIIICADVQGTAFTPPAGFATNYDESGTPGNHQIASFTKQASSESGNYVFTGSATQLTAHCEVYNPGATGGTWTVGTAATTESAGGSATDQTAAISVVADDFLFADYTNDGAASVDTDPSGMTLVQSSTTGGGGNNQLATYYESITGTESAQRTITWSTSSEEKKTGSFKASYAGGGGGATPKGPLGHPFYGPFRGPIS